MWIHLLQRRFPISSPTKWVVPISVKETQKWLEWCLEIRFKKTTGHQLETVSGNKLLCIKTCRVHLIFCCMACILCVFPMPIHLTIFCIYHCFIISSFFFAFRNRRMLGICASSQLNTTTTNIINTFFNRRCAVVGSEVYFYRIGSMYTIKITKKIYVVMLQENVLIDTFLTFQQPFNWIFN